MCCGLCAHTVQNNPSRYRSSSSYLSVEVRVTGAVRRPGTSSADVDGGSAVLLGIVIVFLDHKE